MQHAQQITTDFPWRTATLVVGAVAALELAALIAIGAVHLVPKHPRTAAVPARTTPEPRAAATRHLQTLPAHPIRPRARVKVLVLNGNGVAGAAASAAERLQVEGYRVGGAANAPRHDYARSMVMYVPGWWKEARRLGRDTGVRLVAPLDGLRKTQLRGSKIVLLLGT